MPGLAFVYQRLSVQKSLLARKERCRNFIFCYRVTGSSQPTVLFGNLRQAHPLSWRSALRRRQDWKEAASTRAQRRRFVADVSAMCFLDPRSGGHRRALKPGHPRKTSSTPPNDRRWPQNGDGLEAGASAAPRIRTLPDGAVRHARCMRPVIR